MEVWGAALGGGDGGGGGALGGEWRTGVGGGALGGDGGRGWVVGRWDGGGPGCSGPTARVAGSRRLQHRIDEEEEEETRSPVPVKPPAESFSTGEKRRDQKRNQSETQAEGGSSFKGLRLRFSFKKKKLFEVFDSSPPRFHVIISA